MIFDDRAWQMNLIKMYHDKGQHILLYLYPNTYTHMFIVE